MKYISLFLLHKLKKKLIVKACLDSPYVYIKIYISSGICKDPVTSPLFRNSLKTDRCCQMSVAHL